MVNASRLQSAGAVGFVTGFAGGNDGTAGAAVCALAGAEALAGGS